MNDATVKTPPPVSIYIQKNHRILRDPDRAAAADPKIRHRLTFLQERHGHLTPFIALTPRPSALFPRYRPSPLCPMSPSHLVMSSRLRCPSLHHRSRSNVSTAAELMQRASILGIGVPFPLNHANAWASSIEPGYNLTDIVTGEEVGSTVGDGCVTDLDRQ